MRKTRPDTSRRVRGLAGRQRHARPPGPRAAQVLFRAHTPFRAGLVAFDVPVLASADLAALALAAACLFRLKPGVLKTLGVTSAAGLAPRLVLALRAVRVGERGGFLAVPGWGTAPGRDTTS